MGSVYADIARLVSAAWPSGGKTAAARSRRGLQALQHREGLKDFIYIFAFCKVTDAGIWVNVFT